MLLIITDVETTGLNASTELLLEIAVLLVDSDTMTVIDSYESVIHHAPTAIEHRKVASDPFVVTLHTENNLWNESAQLGAGPVATDLILSEWLKTRISTQEYRTMGNSLRLDLNFIEHHLPKTYDVLGYRSIDMSAVAKFLSITTGIEAPKREVDSTHRAMADTLACLEQARYWRSVVAELQPSRRDRTLFD